MSNETSGTTAESTKKLTLLNRAARRALLDELPLPVRSLHIEVLRRTLAEGIPVNPAALVVVLSAHEDLADEALVFSADHVNELLWFAIAEFCEDFNLVMPDGCSEALHAVLAIGVALDALHPASDPASKLFGAFRQLTAVS